MVKDCQFIK